MNFILTAYTSCTTNSTATVSDWRRAGLASPLRLKCHASSGKMGKKGRLIFRLGRRRIPQPATLSISEDQNAPHCSARNLLCLAARCPASTSSTNVHVEADAEDRSVGLLRREDASRAAHQVGRHG